MIWDNVYELNPRYGEQWGVVRRHVYKTMIQTLSDSRRETPILRLSDIFD